MTDILMLILILSSEPSLVNPSRALSISSEIHIVGIPIEFEY